MDVDEKTPLGEKDAKPQTAQTPQTALQNRPQGPINKQDANFLCVVCSDRASGYHYGVPACEGCKAFFKRSLQSKDLNYKCPAKGNCVIDKMSRKCCQACRLKKCQDVGMSREFLGSKIKKVKGERGKDYSKPSKQKKTEQSDQTENLVESTISAQEVELENMVDKLNVLHSEYFLKIKDKSEPGQDVKEQLCTTVGQQLIRIIDWAKKLPGYCQLAISDQAILLQAAWVDLLVLNWLYFSVISEGGLNISRSCHITKDDAKALGFDNIYSHIVLLIDRAKKYRIDEEEVACLKAISLTNAESSSLEGPDKVNDLITQFSSALQYYTATRHRENPQKFANLVLILPQLKYLVNQLIEFLYTMKINCSGPALTDLVIEMLEAKQRL